VDEVLDEAVRRARAVIAQKNPEHPEPEAAAEAIGVGAVRFAMIKTEAKKQIDFRYLTGKAMEPEMQRIYERLERLERGNERHSAVLDEHSRRLEALEGLPSALAAINQAIGRLEAKIESQKQWSSILQALIWLILGGILAAGFELFKR